MRKIVLLFMSLALAYGVIFDLKIKNFFNKEIDFNDFKNNILVVIVSYDDCKLTDELKAFNDLYLKYKDKNVRFIGFAVKEIEYSNKNFCSINYGVDFDMFDKFNNDQKVLNSYTSKIFLTKDVPIYSPMVVYDKQIIRLDYNIDALEEIIIKSIKEKKK